MLFIGFGSGTDSPAVMRQPETQFSVAEVDGEPMISAANGGLSVTIGAGLYAGSYSQRATDGAPLTVEMINNGPVPLTLPAISGTPMQYETLSVTPSLWIYAGDVPGDQSISWINNTDGATGEVGDTYTLQTTDVADTIKVSEAFGGVTVDSADTAAIAELIIPTRPFAVTQILELRAKESYNAGTADFGTVDLSAYPSGTQILVLQGGINSTAAIIDGINATHLTLGDSYGGGFFAHAFVVTLASQGSAAARILIDQAIDWNSQAVSVYAIDSGIIDDVHGAGAGGGNANLTVNPSGVNNTILALQTFNSNTITVDWSGNITETFEGISGNKKFSLARADDVPVGAFNVTSTLSSSTNQAAVAVSISEAP